MTLCTKDYCNCAHAQELREWIEVALEQATVDSTHWVLTQAIEQDKTLAKRYREERDAVIEAAKALGIIRLLADARDGRDFTTEQCRALRDFEGAVDALQEVEDGNA